MFRVHETASTSVNLLREGRFSRTRKGAAVGRQTRNLEVLECRAATDGSAGTEPKCQAFPGLEGVGEGAASLVRTDRSLCQAPGGDTPLRAPPKPWHQRGGLGSSIPPGADLQHMQDHTGSLPNLPAQ